MLFYKGAKNAIWKGIGSTYIFWNFVLAIVYMYKAEALLSVAFKTFSVP